MFFDVSLVGVSDEVHVKLAVSSLTGLLGFLRVEWLFFFEVVEVLIADLRSDCRLIRGLGVSDIVPVKVFEESMRFDFLNTVST